MRRSNYGVLWHWIEQEAFHRQACGHMFVFCIEAKVLPFWLTTAVDPRSALDCDARQHD